MIVTPETPLRKVARLLRKGVPAYFKCDSNIFPGWTKKRATSWTYSERHYPSSYDMSVHEYVRAFENANNLSHPPIA
jgi:hypothetical protein